MGTLRPEQRALLEEHHFGMLVTVNTQGIPSQVLVWFLVREDEIIVPSEVATQKVKNIQANGWASLAVTQGPRFVSVRARATIDAEPVRVQADYEAIVRRNLPPEAADRWLADRTDQMDQRIIIHIPIEHVIPKEGMPGG